MLITAVTIAALSSPPTICPTKDWSIFKMSIGNFRK